MMFPNVWNQPFFIIFFTKRNPLKKIPTKKSHGSQGGEPWDLAFRCALLFSLDSPEESDVGGVASRLERLKKQAEHKKSETKNDKKTFCVLKYKAKDQSFGFMVFLGVESCHESQTSGFDHVQGNHPGSFGTHPCAGSLLSLRALAVVGMFVFVEKCHKKSQMFAIQSEDFCVFFQPFSREGSFFRWGSTGFFYVVTHVHGQDQFRGERTQFIAAAARHLFRSNGFVSSKKGEKM